ncbi:MAG: glycosyltransferase family 2 protein [Candidatus Krumholzibacteria bacterium]|nr:glycosyltransferase family 2 protein [Candidatus Krumholzibacteria bacterium]MCK5619351.1 glycosyltransferase family 2 protein [Candidatus Krumholzibacteria bacterium]
MKISVVIPCYNEEEGVRYVIDGLPECIDEVVVVDNNSTDRTAEVARSLGANVVFEKRKGYGAAYKAGLPAATGDVIVTLDGDGTYPSEQIPELVDYLEDQNLDFISASRFPLKNPEAMNFTNKIGNNVLTIAMLLLYGTPIKDSQSGMWIFRTRVLPKLNLTSDGMPLSEEIKIEAIRAKDVAFAEYHVNYHPRVGEVKLDKWRDGFRNLVFLVKKRFG